MLSFWVPLYLTTVRHFDLKHIALYAWMPFLAADLGCIFGPSVVLFLQKRGLDLIDARRGAFTLGALMMIGVAFTGVVKDPLMAVALISLAGFAHQTLSVTMITMATDLFPRNEVGTVAGMAGTCANFGILLFTWQLGQRVDQIGYTPVFVLLAVLDILAAVIAWTVIRKPAACLKSATPSFRASIRTPRSAGSAMTITSPPPPSNGFRGCRSIIPATCKTGGF